MEVVSRCELPVAGRLWQPRPGAAALAIVCNATFSLGPGTLALAREQEPVRHNDVPWNAKATSLYAASDVVPGKLRADVLVVGEAYAPRGEPVERLVARIRCGEVDKALEIFCDRTLQADGSVLAGTWFARSPLLYERAAGGPGTENPVGVEHRRDANGDLVLPNITAVGARISRDQPVAPIGFGPVAALWPQRSAKWRSDLPPDGWHAGPLSEIDVGFFNAAPADQQLASLRDDEAIVLDNLHPDHPKLEMRLPGIRLVAAVQGTHGDRQLPLTCDTLWIDTTRGIACLTYRAHLELHSRDEGGRVLVLRERRATPSNAPNADGLPFHNAQPFRSTSAAMPVRRGQALTQAMPIRSANGAPASLPIAEPPRPSPSQPSFAAPVPVSVPPPSSSQAVQVPEPPRSWPQMVAPPLVAPAAVAPPPMGAPVPRVADSGWGNGAAAPARVAFPPIEPVKPIEPAPTAPIEPLSSAPLVKPTLRDAGDALELVFFDRDSLPRIRRVAAWKPLIAALDEKPLDPDEDDPKNAKDSEAIEDRREVIEILVKGDVLDASDLDHAVLAAVRDDGRYIAPVVLVAGEVTTPFDETEMLKATVNTALPLAAGDEALRAALADAQELLKLPPGSSAPAVPDGMTARIRRAFSAAKRPVPNGYLETQTERALIEQRAYQRRNVLGGARQRTILQLSPAPGGGKAPSFVTYLPESAAMKLPLASRFRVRIIARVHLPIEPNEPDPVLEALALARICSIPRRER